MAARQKALGFVAPAPRVCRPGSCAYRMCCRAPVVCDPPARRARTPDGKLLSDILRRKPDLSAVRVVIARAPTRTCNHGLRQHVRVCGLPAPSSPRQVRLLGRTGMKPEMRRSVWPQLVGAMDVENDFPQLYEVRRRALLPPAPGRRVPHGATARCNDASRPRVSLPPPPPRSSCSSTAVRWSMTLLFEQTSHGPCPPCRTLVTRTQRGEGRVLSRGGCVTPAGPTARPHPRVPVLSCPTCRIP